MKFGYVQKNHFDGDFDIQAQALQAAACDEILIDGHQDTKNLAKLLQTAKAGDCVMVWRLDKFAASIGALNRQVATLYDAGVVFVSLQEKIKVAPGAPGVLPLLSMMAEFEKNTARGGQVTGRKPLVTPAKLAKAKALMAGDQPLSVEAAAERIGVSRATLYRALKN